MFMKTGHDKKCAEKLPLHGLKKWHIHQSNLFSQRLRFLWSSDFSLQFITPFNCVFKMYRSLIHTIIWVGYKNIQKTKTPAFKLWMQSMQKETSNFPLKGSSGLIFTLLAVFLLIVVNFYIIININTCRNRLLCSRVAKT